VRSLKAESLKLNDFITTKYITMSIVKQCPKCNDTNIFTSDLTSHLYMCGKCNHKFYQNVLNKQQYMLKFSMGFQLLNNNKSKTR